MKKIIFLILIFFTTVLNVQAEEIKRITVGNKDAKITIIAFESLTCSHCANFHKNVYPQLKEEYLDTGLAKIEFRHFPLDIAAFNASKVSQCKNNEIQISLKVYMLINKNGSKEVQYRRQIKIYKNF